MAPRIEFPKYKPSMDMEQYLKAVVAIGNSHEFSAEQIKQQLLLCFEIGSLPFQLLSDSPASESLSQIQQKLVDTFKGKYSQHNALAAFRTRTQARLETVSEYKESLAILYRSAGGSAENVNTDPFFLDRFVSGLLPNIRDRVRAELPSDTLTALAYAQKAEAAFGTLSTFGPISAVQQNIGIPRPEPSLQNMPLVGEFPLAASHLGAPAMAQSLQAGETPFMAPYLVAASAPQSVTPSSTGTDTLTSLLQDIQQRLQRLEAGATRRPADRKTTGGPRQSRSRSAGRAGCHRCGRQGHLARECRAPYCPQCRGFGHIGPNCQVNRVTTAAPFRGTSPSSRYRSPRDGSLRRSDQDQVEQRYGETHEGSELERGLAWTGPHLN